jgi:3-oxoacyl-[acyl-carrier-protein] synthase II
MRTVHVAMQEEVATGNEEPAAASRPFDLNRRGMVLGEGSGAVVVEELRTAQARKVAILAEVIGFGSSAVTDRQGVGNIRRAMENVIRQALAKAGLRPDDLGHLHAHGLATRNCDQEEASAIQAVFGERRNPLPIVAAKSYMGNLGAAGGMVETIASILALKDGHLFPILNYETPDPLCPIWPVLSLDYPSGDTFLNLKVTPQGQASAIVIRRFA